MHEPLAIETDVLVIGSGAAGMYAAIEASRGGARVFLIDRSLIGRGGATVMAQMTVAAALGEEVPDAPRHHYDDTIAAGRGLCDEALAQLLCEEAPACIRELDAWGVGWARKDNHITATTAPGHYRPRCVYVDFINTGPAVSKTLRTVMARNKDIRKAGDICIVDLVAGSDGEIAGAVGWHVGSGAPVVISAKATIVATGGLTRLYRRNSASSNMGGDGYALALRAGAPLIDMEFVQFFPIGHLAPRLVGMDPIMWDPFRYKLGGRLLNGRLDEFIHRYGGEDEGHHTVSRDLASYAILKEVEAGRGSPHGGVYLDFRHIPGDTLRKAFGPVIDRLLANGIDLTRMPVEVAPTAHYHMGGIAVNDRMETRVEGLFAAGEAVGGANGANRLSGNAITEAFAFGERAGFFAATAAATDIGWSTAYADRARAEFAELRQRKAKGHTPGAMQNSIQDLMWDNAGPFRSGDNLHKALDALRGLRDRLDDLAIAPGEVFNLDLQDWYELKAMLRTSEAVLTGALNRAESRGAHQRIDLPHSAPGFEKNQRLALVDGHLIASWTSVVRCLA